MKLQLHRSDAHFPYRRYSERPHYRAPLRRRICRALRNGALMHDIWCWIYGIAFIVALLVLEVIRAYR